MSMDPQTRRAPNSALGLLLVGVLAGAAGGLLLSGLLPGFGTEDPVPDANLASGEPQNQDNRGNRQQRTIGDGDGSGDSTRTALIPDANATENTAPAPDPLAAEALRAILDRRATEEARLRERARLASESPLTPPVTDIADRIRAWREKKLDVPGQGSAGTVGNTADTGAIGATSATGLADQLSPGPTRRAAGVPTHVLARGSVIPAVLETALDSDLPGLVRARVSGDVYDTLTGSHVLIPRGAQLVGTYGEAARGGQRRLFVAWTDLRMPDGTPVDLGEFSTLGADGAAGVKGKRRTGLLAALGAAVLFDLAGNATQILTGTETREESDLAALLAGATGNATSRVAERYMGDLIDRGPRFRVKAGAIMNVLVEEDMTLPVRETR